MEYAFKSLSVAKFGGSLLDVEGKGIPKIVKRVREIRAKDGFGPIVVFSAPMGCTDALIRMGESYAQSIPVPLDPVFKSTSDWQKFTLAANGKPRHWKTWLSLRR